VKTKNGGKKLTQGH